MAALLLNHPAAAGRLCSFVAPCQPPARTQLIPSLFMRWVLKQRLFWVITPLTVGLLAPSIIIFCLEIFVGRINPFSSLADILRRQFAEGENLFLIALFGLIPFALLSVICLVAARYLSPARLTCVAVGGLLGILTLMVPGHIAVWYPLYGGGHMSSTAVIAFLFIPFYCLVTLAIGLIVGWGISRLPVFRPARNQIV